ncbi:MAG: type III-A CRISPR-associated protein Csm2 [Candidatus Omnitrophota bacterium]|jgi:CRISPR/Cas system CSM-associated protein Csm2 small subunit|nr:MAG: type III-A CRISPR-associated protein Csm2 [Candidatus Omnitrophota bacterium]
MKKVCTQCGKPFHAFKPEFEICPDCNRKNKNTDKGGASKVSEQYSSHSSRGRESHNNPRRDSREQQGLPKPLKLDQFFSSSGAVRREIYMETAEGIAQIFNQEQLTTASVRRFFESVRAAYERFTDDPNKNYEKAMESIYRLLPIAEKSEERDITKRCFTEFMKHYIDLTSKDKKNLKGFKELFMSVVGYMKK